MALRSHTITFTTLYSEELHTRAGRWNFLLTSNLSLLEYDWIIREVAACMSDTMAEEFQRRLGNGPLAPVFADIRKGCKVPLGDLARGEIPSVHRETLREICHFAITDPAIHDYFANTFCQEVASANKPFAAQKLQYNPAFIFDSGREPWKIPTEEELDYLAGELFHVVPAHPQCFNDQGMLKSGEYWKQHWHKLRFSAAAAAAHFLISLSPTNRQHTRKIVVHEDHFSVARPECHAQGLVPFCQENPALRIERRSNLWKTIFMPQLGVNSNPPSSYPLLDGTYGYRAHGLIT